MSGKGQEIWVEYCCLQLSGKATDAWEFSVFSIGELFVKDSIYSDLFL